jgi:hypothetical protein
MLSADPKTLDPTSTVPCGAPAHSPKCSIAMSAK